MRKKDMRTLLKNGMALLIAAGCMVPAGANASTIFTFSNFPTSSGTYTSSSGVTSIAYSTLVINGTTVLNTSGAFTETYSNSTGTLTISGAGGDGSLAGTLITIQDGGTFPAVAGSTTVNLYGAVSSITINNSAFATDLGLTGTTSVLPSSVIAENFGVTTGALTGGTASVSSSVASLTLPVATPEPSTFAMLGLGLILTGFLPARRKLSLNRLPK